MLWLKKFFLSRVISKTRKAPVLNPGRWIDGANGIGVATASTKILYTSGRDSYGTLNLEHVPGTSSEVHSEYQSVSERNHMQLRQVPRVKYSSII